MKYTLEDLKEGTKLICTDNKRYIQWTTGKLYTVKYGAKYNYVETDGGNAIPVKDMLIWVNKERATNATFEIVKEKE
nr:MAG TPA: hypothetical protein [Herelleviridae sp.]